MPVLPGADAGKHARDLRRPARGRREGFLPARHFAGRGGPRRQHIHSSNYLETLDVVRDGVIGGAVGFIAGMIGVALLRYFDPFGVEVPSLVVLRRWSAWRRCSAPGKAAWSASRSENKKLAKFHDDIGGRPVPDPDLRAARSRSAAIRAMMRARHPEAELAAVDRHFINPFSSLRKRDTASGRRRVTPLPQLQKDQPCQSRSRWSSWSSGPLAFHFLSPWWFTPIASNWGADGHTVNLTFWVTGVGLRRGEPVHGVRDHPLPPPQGRSSAPSTSRKTRSSSGG